MSYLTRSALSMSNQMYDPKRTPWRKSGANPNHTIEKSPVTASWRYVCIDTNTDVAVPLEVAEYLYAVSTLRIDAAGVVEDMAALYATQIAATLEDPLRDSYRTILLIPPDKPRTETTHD